VEDLVFRLPFAASRAEGFLMFDDRPGLRKCCRRSA
jgi:hypothetical protein